MDSLGKARQATAAQWNDAVRQRVDREFLLPVEGKFHHALDAVKHLADVLRRAERDCSE